MAAQADHTPQLLQPSWRRRKKLGRDVDIKAELVAREEVEAPAANEYLAPEESFCADMVHLGGTSSINSTERTMALM